MFTLIAMGVTAAYGFSVVAVVAPGVFPDALRQADGSIGVYFESAAVIVVLVLMGQVIELRARGATTNAIRWHSIRSKWVTAFESGLVRRCP